MFVEEGAGSEPPNRAMKSDYDRYRSKVADLRNFAREVRNGIMGSETRSDCAAMADVFGRAAGLFDKKTNVVSGLFDVLVSPWNATQRVDFLSYGWGAPPTPQYSDRLPAKLRLKPPSKGKSALLAKPLGVLRLAAAFPIPATLTCGTRAPGRQQAAALRGRLRREMKLDSNAQGLPIIGAPLKDLFFGDKSSLGDDRFGASAVAAGACLTDRVVLKLYATALAPNRRSPNLHLVGLRRSFAGSLSE